ncbi:MAG: Mrp/NBP35 family ATP-binding protein [Muribaculaceae bacterium]|nr:Mrp/NBP35 family ATP-binding protein [Muribaculaceae bacterium]
MTIYPNLIVDALAGVRYPGNGKSLAENGMIEDDIRIEGNKVSFSLIFDRPTDPFVKSVVRMAESAIESKLGKDVDIKGNIRVKFKAQPAPKPRPVLPGVKNIIGISSGKGGVGKSTVAANVAIALAAKGYKVGLLDADIFGPSMPKMFGVEDEPVYMVNQDGRDWIEPIEKYGVKMLSIGFLVPKENAVLWRGSMASNALRQLINDAWWGELDYFIIDMPPGTSDIHLTLVQTLAITGVVIVTTPQEVALADARKGIAMFKEDKINVPVLGIVENMSWFTPASHPEEKYYLFGNGGGIRLAEESGVKLLVQIPLVAAICTDADRGAPTSNSLVAKSLTGTLDNANPEALAFYLLADSIVEQCDERNRTLPPTSKVEVSNPS